MTKSTIHNPLNSKQLHILKLVHKFRFITAPLLTQYKNLKSRQAMYATLELLAKQEYLSKRIDKSIAFQNKGASYFLAPKAFKVLRETHSADEKSLHAMYNNKRVAESFVDHFIEIIRFYLVLRDSYPGTFHLFTYSELFKYGELPADPRPDLYLNCIAAKGDPKQYILYSFTDKRLFAIKKDFDALIEHFDSGDWEAESETDYPTVLLVCADSRAEESVRRYIAAKLDNTGIDDLEVLTTSSKGLLNSNRANRAIWSDVLEPEVLVSL